MGVETFGVSRILENFAKFNPVVEFVDLRPQLESFLELRIPPYYFPKYLQLLNLNRGRYGDRSINGWVSHRVLKLKSYLRDMVQRCVKYDFSVSMRCETRRIAQPKSAQSRQQQNIPQTPSVR